MMKFYYTLLVLLLFVVNSYAQYTIAGRVIFATEKTPVASASVFFSNTSKGTVTNSNGEFVITQVPPGKLDLIISFIGYETIIQTIDIANASKENLLFELKAKPNTLQEVVVSSYEKQTWEKWGNFFLEHFIGSGKNAEQTSIKNTNKIQFRFYKKQNVLKAICDEEIIIENKALGYKIKYRLEDFTFNFKEKLLTYEGFPFIEPMITKRKKLQNKWDEARLEAYHGSIMHFMRSVYRNKIVEEGFEVRRLYKDTNYEKMRVRQILKQNFFKNIDTTKQAFNFNNRKQIVNQVFSTKIEQTDSSNYYNNIIQQPDLIDRFSPYTVTGDSIAYAADSTTAALAFSNHLYVKYLHKMEEEIYLVKYGLKRLPTSISSSITLFNQPQVMVYSNGSYYKSTNLISDGYWGWSEKISNLLPLDYQPPK